MVEKKVPSWFIPWRELGFIRPETAKKWMISGFKPDVAAPWYHLDEVEVHIASDWVRHGLTSSDFVSWTRCGFRSPAAVVKWRKYFHDPIEAQHWRSVGLRVDGISGELLERGYSPEVVLHADLVTDEISIDDVIYWMSEFNDVELLSTGQLKQWIQTGLTPSEIKFWIAMSVNISLVSKFRNSGWAKTDLEMLIEEWGENGLSLPVPPDKYVPTKLLGWRSLNFSQLTALAWINNGFGPDEAALWVECGIGNVNDVQKWRKTGCAPEEVQRLRSEGWSDPTAFAKLKLRGWWVSDVVEFQKNGVNRNMLLAWYSENAMGYQRWKFFLEHTIRNGSVQKWLKSEIPIDQLPRWVDLVSGSVDVCVQWFSTGLSPEGVNKSLRQHKCRAEDFDPNVTGLSLLSVLATRNRLIDNRYRTETLEKRLKGQPVVSATADDSFRKDFKIPSSLQDVVVDEFQAKAVYLARLLKKLPAVGMEFSDVANAVSIRIDSVEADIFLTVSIAGRSYKIRINGTNFDPVTKLASNELKSAYVLGLSWFIDCCISLRSDRNETQQLFRLQESESRKSAIRTFRYVPTMRFEESIRQVGAGAGLTPVLHHVSGHIRRLPEGHVPSPDSVKRAPRFLRKTMKPGDTFVVGHTRGSGDDVVEFSNRLSKYSLTAHAFAAVFNR